jgi:hypothetical protein
MEISPAKKYHMLVSAGLPGEYQVKLVMKEAGMFRVLLSATSFQIPPLEWLIQGYEQSLKPQLDLG